MSTGDVPPSPEAAGIPDHADDDSTAYDDTRRPQLRDSPPPLPADTPQAVDETGVTAAEQREGESLEEQLAREEPDVTAAAEETAEDRRPGSAESSAEEAALRVEPDERDAAWEDVPYEP